MEKSSHCIVTNNIHFCYLLSLVLVCCYSKCAAANGITIGSDNTTIIMCVEEEREALLKFKQGITADRCRLLSSWGDNQNCCEWSGVHCDNHTSRVTVIDLHGNEEVFEDDYHHPGCIEGRVSSSLVDLNYLTYLDLSLNYFHEQPIPSFIGSLVNLKHLNLSNTGFAGEIPQQLGNLSSLISLDLSHAPWYLVMHIYVNDLSWLSRLTRLTTLNLGHADLSNATNWLQNVNNLPFLRVLQLDDCNFPPLTFTQSMSYKNSTTALSFLSLRLNSINDSSMIFEWLFNLSGINTHLAHLDLANNQLSGPLPTAFGSLHSLSYLDLSLNEFQGNIPSSFGDMQSLTYLDLSSNELQGNIPSSFGNMHSLTYLSLADNHFEGQIFDTFPNIKALTHLDLSYNNLRSLQKTLDNLCSLQELLLGNNNLTNELSNIIQSLSGCANKSLMSLDLRENQIWGSVPDSIGGFSALAELNLYGNKLNGTVSESLGQLSMLETLFLSSNLLNCTLSSIHFSNLFKLRILHLSNNTALTLNFSADWVPPFQLASIDLSDIKLGPLFPKWIMTQTNYSELFLSNAGISGSIPDSFLSLMPSNMSGEIDLSFNNIEGAIPIFPSGITSLKLNNNKFSKPVPFLCPKSKSTLEYIDLSNNLLYGELPDCWINFPQLQILQLENNRLYGVIPSSISYLTNLQVLHLRNNSIDGGMQRLLVENLTSLVVLELSHNSLIGLIPSSIGNHFRSLSLLILKNNKFDGVIPVSLCQMSNLQILDLSSNHITGTIPKCISNFSAMQSGADRMPYPTIAWSHEGFNIYRDTTTLNWKKEERSFHNTLGQVKEIDLSNNKLDGEIPDELSFLKGLKSLDLSRNNLRGGITPKIGELTALEFLDLSNNHLSGEIPTSFIDLNFLSMFNVSSNNLSGKIPSGTQLQSFNASAYVGNPGLCGVPLPKCSWDHSPNNSSAIDNNNVSHHDAKESDDFVLGLCISIMLGFIVGFWGACGTLVLKRSWRLAFFQSFDDIRGKFCVRVSMTMARVRRRQ